VRILSSEARGFSASDLAFLETLAARGMPQDYRLHVGGLRARYLGNQAHYTREALKKRYARSWRHMPQPGFNFARLFAEQDATVYDESVQRHLVLDGEKIEDKGPEEGEEGNAEGRERAKRFAALCSGARLDRVMPEVERRLVLVRTMFVRVDYGTTRATTDGAHESILLFPLWPDQVRVIPHHSMPASLGTAVGCIVDIAGPRDNGEEWREVWTREADEDERGKVKRWGPWSVVRVSTKGQSYRPYEGPYPLPSLPIAKVALGDPEGGPYAPPDYDLPDNIDELNVEWANYKQVKAYQAHSRTFYAGNQQKPETFPAGPDAIIQIGNGERLDTLTMSPDLEALLDGVTSELGLNATLRQNAADAYSIDSSRTPESGIARQIKNEPMLKARRARVLVWKDFEENDLLPLMVEVADHWGGTEIHADGIGYVMTPGETPEYEEAEARQRRAIEAEGEGLISKARAAVMCGLYRSIEDAKAAGLSDKIEEKQEPPPFGFGGPPSRFAARLAERRAGKQPAKEEAGPDEEPEAAA
jgi:hypothetical protein